MTELTYAQFDADQTFVDPHTGNNDEFDCERFRLLADRIKPLLGSRLENRIHSVLEEFVCKSSSRYSRRFPRVKRCLDAIAAWLNYLDLFRAKDIDEEAIKHAIECLLKDGRVTHFEDPVALNTGISRVDPDSLTEQNAMKNMNVWSFIKEKDYWLSKTNATCESPRTKQKCKKENCNSDLDVEVGSSTKEFASNKRHSTNPSCNQKIDNTTDPKVQHNQEMLFCFNENTPSTKEAVEEFTLSSTEKNLKPSNCTKKCGKNRCPKSPKLKLVIYKTASTNGSTLWNPVITRLSVPCKPSHLIVRLFEADPSLSDSCLILIRRKFEHEIRSACSCMNDILKKMDSCTIRRLRLNCQIRPGRIDLTLQRDSSKTLLFLARVPICLNVHKRESSCRNVGNRCESRCSNLCVPDDSNKEEFQERQVAFYSQCSNHSLGETKTSHAEDAKERKELNFVWSRRERREVDFVLSARFTKSQTDFDENSTSANENSERSIVKICDEDNAKINENKVSAEEGIVEIRKDETSTAINDEEIKTALTYPAEKNYTCANSSVMDDQRELHHTVCSYSSSLKDEVKQNHTVSDSEQCYCHVLYVNNSEKNTKDESYLTKKCGQNVTEKDNVEIHIVESVSESKTQASKLQTNIRVRSSLRKTLVAEFERNILETDYSSSMKETCSSISSSKSDKCSRCGNDLSEEMKSVTKFQPISDSENQTTRDLKNLTKPSTKCLPPSQSVCKTVHNPTIRTFVMSASREQYQNKNIIDREENAHSCKSNNSNSTCRKQFSRSNSCMETESFPEKDSKKRNRKTNVKFGSSDKPICLCSSKALHKEKDTGSRHLFRRKNSFWRGSIVPGSICSSFPALDRIKYLIRKKLRRLLLEERDKGTSTSKTYLRTDRYLVSISSGKLNEERICSSIRCPFTTRNQMESRGPQKTFTEGCLKEKEVRGRRIQDNEVFRKIRLGEISRFLGQKGGSKINNQTIDGDEKRRTRSSVESFTSTKVILDVDQFDDKVKHKAHKRSCDFKAGKLTKGICKEEIAPKSAFRNYRGVEVSVDKGREGGDALRGERSKPFDKRSFKCCRAKDCEDKEFMNLLNNYERRITDLDADFRLKLLQYVALCRSVKDLLMKRLPQTDDVYEGSSSCM
ncbi:uncharacterized protein LOC143266600 [Megachile rotundata]|uniref:uncharacterized protein LOC143266600 n=1 Tax=Megachile rotundata TaxID=143995 RepID=UPI003FD3B1B5